MRTLGLPYRLFLHLQRGNTQIDHMINWTACQEKVRKPTTNQQVVKCRQRISSKYIHISSSCKSVKVNKEKHPVQMCLIVWNWVLHWSSTDVVSNLCWSCVCACLLWIHYQVSKVVFSSHQIHVYVFSLTPTTTSDAAVAPAGGVSALTHGAALSIGDHHLVAVTQLITLDLVAEDLAVVTHTHPAWLWLPDVPVAVHLAVRRAAQIITCIKGGGQLVNQVDWDSLSLCIYTKGKTLFENWSQSLYLSSSSSVEDTSLLLVLFICMRVLLGLHITFDWLPMSKKYVQWRYKMTRNQSFICEPLNQANRN